MLLYLFRAAFAAVCPATAGEIDADTQAADEYFTRSTPSAAPPRPIALPPPGGPGHPCADA